MAGEAVYHGKNSSAFWEETIIVQVTEWTYTLNADTAESTVMHATETGKLRLPGFKGGTAAVTTFLSGDNIIDEGVEGTLELLRNATNAGKGLLAEAICIGVSDGVDMNGIETVTYNFQLTGTITNSVTEGTG